MMMNKSILKDIRISLINGFIENTRHFTQGAFDKLLNAQMDTFRVRIEQGHYDEAKQEDIAIKALSNAEEIISFDKIKPSLIFFHEDDGKLFNLISIYG